MRGSHSFHLRVRKQEILMTGLYAERGYCQPYSLDREPVMCSWSRAMHLFRSAFKNRVQLRNRQQADQSHRHATGNRQKGPGNRTGRLLQLSRGPSRHSRTHTSNPTRMRDRRIVVKMDSPFVGSVKIKKIRRREIELVDCSAPFLEVNHLGEPSGWREKGKKNIDYVNRHG